MLKRYKQLQPYLFLFERDCEVDRCIPEDAPEDDTRRFPTVQYLPSPAEHCTILDLLDDMDLLELATNRLQARNLSARHSGRDVGRLPRAGRPPQSRRRHRGVSCIRDRRGQDHARPRPRSNRRRSRRCCPATALPRRRNQHPCACIYLEAQAKQKRTRAHVSSEEEAQ
ncbi:hypothetical protein PHYSODRAFT_285740, partial [Phytophthora sojae]